jgi:hypothetical protein
MKFIIWKQQAKEHFKILKGILVYFSLENIDSIFNK